jgi:hypothetical protein
MLNFGSIAIGHADQWDSLRTINWTGAVAENAMCSFHLAFLFLGKADHAPIQREA